MAIMRIWESMKVYPVALSLLLVGCGRGPNSIDPAFQSFYNQFVSDSNQNGIPMADQQGLTMKFAVPSGSTALAEIVGECQGVGYGNSTIIIDPDFWEQSSYQEQLLIAFHEMGHCLLDEDHVADPNAIMNPYISNSIQQWVLDPASRSGTIQQLFEEKGDNG
jgi:hypothetical protein